MAIGRPHDVEWPAKHLRRQRRQHSGELIQASNTVTVNGDTTPRSGGTGQFSIGTFTADATTQTVTFQGHVNFGTLENAFQLRNITAVPEPGTLALFLSGAGLLACKLHRSRGGYC